MRRIPSLDELVVVEPGATGNTNESARSDLTPMKM